MTFSWLSPQLIYPVEVQNACGFAIIMIFTLLLTTKRMLMIIIVIPFMLFPGFLIIYIIT